MKIKLLHTGPLATNTYLLYDESTKLCAVVDPADSNTVEAFMLSQGLKCTHILLTHGHFDHVMGVAALKRSTGALVCISREDAQELLQEEENPVRRASLWGYKIEKSPVDIFVSDGDIIQAAGFELRVISTPGHTQGGVCYVLEKPEKVIFAGDTLFRANVGRADLPGGSPAALFDSVNNRLFTLSGDYMVYPGHDAATTLEYERENNPYIKCGSYEEW